MAAPPPATSFESWWQDGRAELAGYRYHVTRYGQRRTGRCAMITVTEPFSAAKRVKVDDPSKNPADTFEALKLNLSRSFQTGIYDYHTMISLFTRSRDFAPVKVAFSATEWCGQVYEEQAFGPRAISGFVRSYFEDESRALNLPAKPGGIAEDDLFLVLRGLRGDFLPPGRSRSLPLLASPFITRLAHRAPDWVVANVARAREPVQVHVPAGSFPAILYTAALDDGRTGRFWIEAAWPHRVLKWTWTATAAPRGRMGRDGLDEGELIGSTRLPYWQLNQPGGERYLRELGLAPLTPSVTGR
ncbi:MAG TPA: hypothetical protein VFM00_08890 [Candidatus Eisenbacteria bacterium]|nr:hypothetical protein [Candidatus Eisenbacteria bacterium]